MIAECIRFHNMASGCELDSYGVPHVMKSGVVKRSPALLATLTDDGWSPVDLENWVALVNFIAFKNPALCSERAQFCYMRT